MSTPSRRLPCASDSKKRNQALAGQDLVHWHSLRPLRSRVPPG
jgi:hypothetical protein